MTQAHCFLATELALKAQQQAPQAGISRDEKGRQAR
jgi:hypothetical protein